MPKHPKQASTIFTQDSSTSKNHLFFIHESGDHQLCDTWFLDSNVSCHMTSNLDWFMERLLLPNNKHVFLGDDIVK
jgi:hypothetical protein